MKAVTQAIKELKREVRSIQKCIAALEKAKKVPKARRPSIAEVSPKKRKYQRRRPREEEPAPEPQAVHDDPRCGRGECTHTKSQHNKPGRKCSVCWCYEFVQRAA